MNKQLSTQELADFLGVTRQGLKKMVDNNSLAGKLLEKGYKCVKSERQGRKIIYFLEEIKVISKTDWDTYMKKEFPSVRKKEQFIDYSALRLDPEQPTLVSQVSKTVSVDKKTGYRWEDLLIEKQIMMRSHSSDEDNYWVITNGKIYPSTKEDYIKFCETKKELLEKAKVNTEIRTITNDSVKTMKRLIESQLGCFYFKSRGILINNLLPQTQEFLDKLDSVREGIKEKYNMKGEQ